MPIRVSGLNSGLDTDAIVQELVSAYRTKGDKIKKQQTKLSWTQDKWKSLNAKVLNLYKSLDSLRFSAGYNMKKTTVSDPTKATVTAGKNSMNGTQTLRIDSTATAGYLTGEQLKNNKRGSAAKLSYLMDENDPAKTFTGSGTFRISVNDGVSKEIEIKDTDTISDFINKINDSGTGVRASYDTENQRIFISSSATGEKNDFSLTAKDTNAAKALSALGVNIKPTEELDAWQQYKKADGTVNEILLRQDFDKLLGMKQQQANKQQSINAIQKNTSERQVAISYLNSYSDKVAVEKEINDENKAEQLSKLANLSDADREKYYVIDKTTGLYEVDQDGNFIEATAAQIASGDAEQGTGGIARYEDKKDDNGNIIKTETKLYQQLKAYNSNVAAVKNYAGNYVLQPGEDAADEIKKHNDEIEKNTVAIERLTDDIADLSDDMKDYPYSMLDSQDVTANMKPQEINDYMVRLTNQAKYFIEDYSDNLVNNKANKQAATDAKIYLNDVDFTSSSNTFNINGLTIQANAKTNGDITITTATDTQALYDKIKDFISEYNSIINEMSTLYNAPSSKGYEPLTSDEKQALSESEIADWEKKIKDSLLRRDGNLSTLMNAMTSAMSKTYEINGKKYSLASLGIKTGSYFNTTAADRYELHIDGDPDDDTTSANADQLMAMLNSDPDTVISIIQGAASDLSENLSKQMKSSTLRSYQSIYNDKAMAQSYSDYTKKISAWEEKVTAIEESYYKKFAAMEKALAKLQSQQSAFSGMLGS